MLHFIHLKSSWNRIFFLSARFPSLCEVLPNSHSKGLCKIVRLWSNIITKHIHKSYSEAIMKLPYHKKETPFFSRIKIQTAWDSHFTKTFSTNVEIGSPPNYLFHKSTMKFERMQTHDQHKPVLIQAATYREDTILTVSFVPTPAFHQGNHLFQN